MNIIMSISAIVRFTIACCLILLSLQHLTLAKDLTFKESFSKSSEAWEKAAGYYINHGDMQSLLIQDSIGEVYWLNKDLVPQSSLQFFMKMPKFDGVCGFQLKNKFTGDILQFSIKGTKYPDENRDTFCLIELIQKKQKTTLFQSSFAILNSNWHKFLLERNNDNFTLSINNHFVSEFNFQSEKVQFGFWGKGEKACLVDEFIMSPITYLANDLFSKNIVANPSIPNGWLGIGGDWQQVYLPSLRHTVVIQQSPGRSTLLCRQKLNTAINFSTRIKMDQPGQAGIIMDYKGSNNFIAITLATGQLNGFSIVKHIDNEKFTLAKYPAPIFSGIWYKMSVNYVGGKLSVTLNNSINIESDASHIMKGSTGIYSDSQGRVLFDSPAIKDINKKQSFLAMKDLSPTNLGGDWQGTRSFSSLPEVDKLSRMSFTYDMDSSGRFSFDFSTHKKSFSRFIFKLTSMDHLYEINLFKWNNNLHSVILSNNESLENINSTIPEEMKSAFKDDFNQDYNILYHSLVPGFARKKSLFLSLKQDKDMGLNCLNLSFNNEKTYSFFCKSNEAFYIELGSVGGCTLDNVNFLKNKNCSKLDQMMMLNAMQFLEGEWSYSGMSTDHFSLDKLKSIKLNTTLPNSYRMNIELEAFDEESSVVIHDQALDKNPSFIIDTKVGGARGVSTVKAWHGARTSAEIFTAEEKSGGSVYLEIEKYNSLWTWKVNNEEKASSFYEVNKDKHLHITREGGPFRMYNFQLYTFPDYYCSFSNKGTFLDDSSYWINNKSLGYLDTAIPGQRKTSMSRAFHCKLFPNSKPTSFFKALPANFAFSIDLKYLSISHLSRYDSSESSQHIFHLYSSGQRHELHITPLSSGCFLEYFIKKKSKFSKMIKYNEFTLHVTRTQTNIKVSANNEIVGKIAIQLDNMPVTLKTQVIAQQNNLHVMLENFCLYFLKLAQ
ncbi:MAG: hypothetical protein HQL32_01455 [Planctomycetes bacterium]|nr:hypothetical protein [Planctomycetota bacterium]